MPPRMPPSSRSNEFLEIYAQVVSRLQCLCTEIKSVQISVGDEVASGILVWESPLAGSALFNIISGVLLETPDDVLISLLLNVFFTISLDILIGVACERMVEVSDCKNWLRKFPRANVL